MEFTIIFSVVVNVMSYCRKMEPTKEITTVRDDLVSNYHVLQSQPRKDVNGQEKPLLPFNPMHLANTYSKLLIKIPSGVAVNWSNSFLVFWSVRCLTECPVKKKELVCSGEAQIRMPLSNKVVGPV